MQFGIAAFPKDYLPAARAGFDYVELPCKHIAAMPADAFAAFAKTVAGGPIPALAMNLYCPPEVVIAGPGFDVDTARVYAARAARRAATLGVKLVGVGSPLSRTLPQGFPPELAEAQAGEFLAATADIFGAKGITVCFEALSRVFCNFANHLQQAVDLARAVDHPWLRVVLDFYNMEHEGEAEQDLVPLMPLVAHAHLSDDEGGDPRRRSYLLPAKTDMHTRHIRALAATGYNAALTLEIDLPVDIERAQESLAVMRGALA